MKSWAARLRVKEVEAEGSIALRVAVAAAVMVAVSALIAQDIVGTRVAVLAVLGIPAGSALSWFRRHERNVALKVMLSAGAILALARFLTDLSGATSVEEARAPLAEIFLLVQLLHSFDLPRRRDLSFSLASSLTLMALAGSLSLDSSFAAFLLPWGILGLISLQLSHRSEVREWAEEQPAARSEGLRRQWVLTLVSLVTVLAIGGLALMFAPRVGGSRFTAVAFRIPNLLPVPPGAGILNPGLSRGNNPGALPDEPGPNSYFGFGNFVDLRVRSSLSDEVVMKVRSPRPAFWRGAVFDEYRDSAWRLSTPATQPVIGLPARIRGDVGGEPPRTTELIQTFHIQRPQPNLIFAAYKPELVWFPVRQLDTDDQGSVRARVLLGEETVYSVLSRMPLASAEDLQVTPEGTPPELLARYTQLPPDLPRRVRDLASQIAGREATIIGKARAIERWLAKNTRYQIEIPPQPRGTDAVDHFLFEERRGFCEQIATSMVVMLRSLGVPARFATGYAPGEQDLFSGFFDVRQSDAHAWVEVYFPGTGWMEFDPTHEVPLTDFRKTSIPGIGLLKDLFEPISDAIPDGMGAAAARAIRSAFSAVASSGPRLAATLAAVAAAAALVGWARPRVQRWRRVRRSRMSMRREGRAAMRAFLILEEAASGAGYARAPSLTPHEYGLRLKRSLPGVDPGDIDTVIVAAEKELYSGVTVPAGDGEAAEMAAGRISSRLLGQAQRVLTG